jgi:hypothetical protein
MRIRNIVATFAIVAATAGTTAALTSGSQADAATTTISTESVTKVMISSLCYRETAKTVTPYYHSAGHGWVRYAAPKVTTTVSTHCYPR